MVVPKGVNFIINFVIVTLTLLAVWYLVVVFQPTFSKLRRRLNGLVRGLDIK
jgi:hypothetical protein